MKFWALWLAGVMLLAAGVDAEAARRFGGGKSIGRQSSNVTQRATNPPPHAPPAGGAAQGAGSSTSAAPAGVATPGAAAPVRVAPRKPWGALLGGLAAGLGLAWLANMFGLGAAFGQALLVMLLALLALAVVALVLRSRRARPAAAGGPFAFQGVGAGTMAETAVTPPQYNPGNVGNDASARPWERGNTQFEASPSQPAATGGLSGGSGVLIGSALSDASSWSIPADFDTQGFLEAAKHNFVRLQDAWDRSDLKALRAMMTDEMVTEIQAQLAEREQHLDGQPNRTDVVMLEAKLLGIEDLGQDYMASVEFSGTIRETLSAVPSLFREVWNMTKPKSGGSGWLVAGVQALQ